MAMIAPALATLMMAAAVPSVAEVATAGGASIARPTTASRAIGGASAMATVSARILRTSAAVGEGRGAPVPLMIARRTTVAAADGRLVPALVYDFE